jgi:hypothetical protein
MAHAQFDSCGSARFAVTVAQMACLTLGAGASTGAFPSHCMLRISCPYYIGRNGK